MTTEIGGDLPMDPRLVWQLSQATVKSPADAIVELVTNSEDSYARLGSTGDITVLMKSLGRRGGVLAVRDEAEGMTAAQLREAVIYGARSSGQAAGSGIRGLFGRGLKESILALGRGVIITHSGGKASYAEIYAEGSKPKYRLNSDPPIKYLQRTLSEFTGLKLPSPHGTIVLVRVQKIRIPRETNLKWQIENHFALRKILSKPGRRIRLLFQDPRGRQRSYVLRYETPAMRKVLEKTIDTGTDAGQVSLAVFESAEALDLSRAGPPFSRSGVLVTSDGVPLDNTLFAFAGETAACYFQGELEVPGFARLFEKEDFSFLTPQRNGLDWRSEVCKVIWALCTKELGVLVERKREELATPASELGEERKAQLRRVCQLLNNLLADYEMDLVALGPGGPVPVGALRIMMIVPEYAILHPGTVRSLSVYAPVDQVANGARVATITLSGVGVGLVDPTIEMTPSKSDSNVLYGYFRTEGRTVGQIVVAKASLGGLSAFATLEVTKEERRGRKKKHQTGRGGPFSEVRFDVEPQPIQPVKFDSETGTIRVFVKFPYVRLYMKADGGGLDRAESRAVFADLVGEAFCRHVARRGLDSGKYPMIPGAEIDNYESAYNALRLQAMGVIHKEVESILATRKESATKTR